jgi:predicted nucleotidyltransferase
MTFVVFVLAFLRYKLNIDVRTWRKGVDSYSPLDIWYIVSEDKKLENKVDFDDKLSKMKELDEKLEKI